MLSSKISLIASISTSTRPATNFGFLPPFDPEAKPKVEFEVIKSPEVWKYVDRVLPPKLIPVPRPREEYHSDWRPPTADPKQHPYYIPRNKNLMTPVYLIIRKRGTQRITRIRHVKGDIFAMEADLRKYIKEQTGRELGMRVDEFCGHISIRGDFVYHVKNWLEEKGF
ncbi:unnamed protein product [Nesidiocoris tenuis]|uniref:Large ribosomal subunit protein mL49 n=1 Tax=Nesidiocoris tenuis TaxID=355587 RepID=A0A6H5HPI8_9HEMI|nr:unnamed protein product [Nesidiocoris tenuis]